jgi:hypothetical protein
MDRKVNLNALALTLGLPLLSCADTANQISSVPLPALTCHAGADCDGKWSRATSWVTTNSQYKIQTATPDLIQTMGPTDSNPAPAYTVTKVSTAPGIYELTFSGGCDNPIGCVPTVADSRASFYRFVSKS